MSRADLSDNLDLRRDAYQTTVVLPTETAELMAHYLRHGTKGEFMAQAIKSAIEAVARSPEPEKVLGAIILGKINIFE